MILSYLIEPFGGDKRQKVKAKITTASNMSSYGQPVIILSTGRAVDLISWIGCGYRIEQATPKETAQIQKMFGGISLSVLGVDKNEK